MRNIPGFLLRAENGKIDPSTPKEYRPMPAVTEAPPVIEEVIEEDFSLDTGEAPPIFGRCPVCGKPLFPRDRLTGQPKAPPAGTGYESRAKCSGCGTII